MSRSPRSFQRHTPFSKVTATTALATDRHPLAFLKKGDPSMHKALSIAASDSGGACGIQADLKTFTALGVYGASAVTAVTAQNSMGMADVVELEPSAVAAQARLVLSDIRPEAVKIGMIGKAENYEALAHELATLHQGRLVVDPVVTCYRGCAFVLGQDAIAALKAHVLPLVDVFAPSIPDAEVILGTSIQSVSEMEAAVRAIKAMGPRLVVLKGGHLDSDPVDVIFDGESMVRLVGRRIHTEHDNGSGCVFSAAIAAFLARAWEPIDAIREAKRFMEDALRHAVAVGQGHGPANPLHALAHAHAKGEAAQ